MVETRKPRQAAPSNAKSWRFGRTTRAMLKGDNLKDGKRRADAGLRTFGEKDREP